MLENMQFLPYNKRKILTIVNKSLKLHKKENGILNNLYKKQSSYSPMLNDSPDYDAFSGTSPYWDFFGLHYHDFFEFYLFSTGVPYFCVDENVIPLKTYTLVIIPPYILHGLVSNQPSNNYERFWMYTSPAIMHSVGMGIHDFSAFFKECVEKGKFYFYLDKETADKLKYQIELIKENVNKKSPIDRWRNAHCVAEFLNLVYEIAQSSESECKPVIINETIQSVLNYINNNYAENLSIASLSKEFAISPSYLSRSFSAYTGRSIYNYIQYRRIMLAKEMICANKPFMDVALECGFNDYSCFLRAFTKSTGKTPREYKNFATSLDH